MTTSLNIQLTEQLRRFIDMQTSGSGVYATPSEYIRDLIRRDMANAHKAQEREIAEMLLASKNSPSTPLEKDFFKKGMDYIRKRDKLKKKTN